MDLLPSVCKENQYEMSSGDQDGMSMPKRFFHLEAKAKQEHQKAGESSPLKQLPMMSFTLIK
jgi:hypothetical protein